MLISKKIPLSTWVTLSRTPLTEYLFATKELAEAKRGGGVLFNGKSPNILPQKG